MWEPPEYLSSIRHSTLLKNLGIQFHGDRDQGWNKIWSTCGMGATLGNRAQDAVQGRTKGLVHKMFIQRQAMGKVDINFKGNKGNVSRMSKVKKVAAARGNVGPNSKFYTLNGIQLWA